MRRFINAYLALTFIAATSLVGNVSHAQGVVLDPDCPTPQQAIRVQIFRVGSITTIGQVLAVETRNNEVKITLEVSQIGGVPPAQGPVEITIGPFAAGSYVISVVGREVTSNGYGPEIPVGSRQIQVQDNPPACTPASIMLISPTYQDAVLQQPFASPIAVRVLDVQSRPVPGVRVFFDRLGPESIDNNAQAPDVAFAQSQALTDTNGVANTTATAGSNPGVAQYRAYYIRGDRLHFAYFVLANRTASSSVGARPIIEFYNTALKHYFITANEAEQRDLDLGIHPNWIRTGNGFLTPSGQSDSNATPVCRLYGLPTAGLDSHFYSGDPSECDAVLQRWPMEWVLETKEAFRSYLPDLVSGLCGNDRIPVYRLYNGQSDANHRYTTSASIRAQMRASGWISEGYGPDGIALCAPL